MNNTYLIIGACIGLALIIFKWRDLMNSFKNNSEGWSGRKISAAGCFVCAYYIALKQIPTEDKIYAMNALLIAGGVCLGLVTSQQILEFFSLKKGTFTESSKIETTSETKLT